MAKQKTGGKPKTRAKAKPASAKRAAGVKSTASKKTAKTKPITPPASNGPDMRSWMRDLEMAGLLRRVKAEVDWDEEIGALARANLALKGPGLLLENIKDYQDTICTQMLTCAVGARDQILRLVRLPRDATDKELVRHFKNVYHKPVAPMTVENGPVKSNILTGAEIDLNQFPAAK